MLSCPGRTHFSFYKQSHTCQVSEILVFDNFSIFLNIGECIEDKLFICLLLRATATHTRYSCIRVAQGVGMYWRCSAWVSGVASWCELSGHHFSSHSYWRVMPPLKWSVHLIIDHYHFEFLLSLSLETSLPSIRDLWFLLFFWFSSSLLRYTSFHNVFHLWFYHGYGRKWL